ncbi:MAG TPA: outer membrane beta-barrel protein [Gemmatimonadaceae bacterium]|nr:outer membrane beta-barrel protein [Gemmatimonadaceae bacterium]
MRLHRFVLGAALAASVATVSVAEAQSSSPIGVELTPYAGYMHFGDLFEFSDGTELSMKDAALFGVQGGVRLGQSWALLGNLGYVKSEFTNEFPSAPQQSISPDVGVFLMDASLQYKLPVYGPVAPFIQGGVGGIKYTFDTDDIQGAGNTDVAFNAGVGADVQLSRALGLRLMVKDYITNLSWDNLNDVQADDDIEGNTAHNLGFSLGLKIGF